MKRVGQHIAEATATALLETDDAFCSNCHHTGVLLRVVDNGAVIDIRTTKCICTSVVRQRRNAEDLLSESNIPDRYLDSDIDSYDNPGINPEQLAANEVSLGLVRSYGDRIPAMRRHGYGLFICGPNGVGKTYLACGLLRRAAMANCTVRFYTMAKIIATEIAGWRDEEAKAVARGLEMADVLVVDDVDKVYKTRTGIETVLFDNLLRERVQRCRPVIMTSNINLAQCRNFFTESVHSLLQEHVAEAVFVGRDVRPNMAQTIRSRILGDS